MRGLRLGLPPGLLCTCAFVASLGAALAAGCQAPACAPGTVRVVLALPGAAAQADALAVTLTVDGAAEERTVARAPGAAESLELTFAAGYPRGQSIALSVVALAGPVPIAGADDRFTAEAGCTSRTLVLAALPDGGLPPDLGDAGPEVDATCVPLTACPAAVGCGPVDDGCGAALDCGACQLTALEPAVANTGATVTLEGSFSAAGATAIFPGGASQPATVLGPHRAQVIVPEAAGDGLLTVATGGQVVGGVRFRRAAFPLGLGRFDLEYPQTDGPRPRPSLRSSFLAFPTWRVDDALYVADYATVANPDGGMSYQPILERATIHADGTLSTFQVVRTDAFTFLRQGAVGATFGNSLYVAGGTVQLGAATGAQPSVERATVGADGTLSAFVLEPTVQLVTPRTAAVSAVIGDSWYVIGGLNEGAALDSIERARIAPDGTLGPFELVPDVKLVVSRGYASAEVIGPWLYVLGGYHASDEVDSVERAAIAPDGTLGAFETVSGVRLVQRRYAHASLVLGDALYVVGGDQGGFSLGSVERATIDAGGDLSTFATVAGVSLAKPRLAHGLAVTGNYLHVIGGLGSLSSVEHASIDVQGALGSFTDASVPQLRTPRYGLAGATWGRSLYVAGGAGTVVAAGAVERASLGDDGALGSFAATGITLARSPLSALVATGGWLYSLGGALNSIDRASIQGDGSLSAFAKVGAFATTRSACASAAVGGYLYAVGGYSGSAYLASVERAAIGADGSLGSFAAVTDLALVTARSEAGILVSGSSLYVLGGIGSAGRLSSVERAAIAADGSLGSFATVDGVSLKTARAGFAAEALGSWLYVIGGSGDGPVYLGGVERAPIGADGTLGDFAPVPAAEGAGLVTSHADGTSVVLGNALYTIGGLHASTGTPQLAPSERAPLQ